MNHRDAGGYPQATTDLYGWLVSTSIADHPSFTYTELRDHLFYRANSGEFSDDQLFAIGLYLLVELYTFDVEFLEMILPKILQAMRRVPEVRAEHYEELVEKIRNWIERGFDLSATLDTLTRIGQQDENTR
jgi:hypothetical protein